jgi:CarD family transcriptional regulator
MSKNAGVGTASAKSKKAATTKKTRRKKVKAKATTGASKKKKAKKKTSDKRTGKKAPAKSKKTAAKKRQPTRAKAPKKKTTNTSRRKGMDGEFSIGEKAVYPAQGVAEVVGIEEKSISNNKIKFYVLRILDTEMKIMVPTKKAEQVGLRRLASTDDIDRVMEILEEQDVKMDKQTWNRRYRGFMEKIKTGSLFEVAEVYRDLSRLKHTKTLSFGEKRMLDTARSLIVKELSVAQEKAPDKVEKKLEKIFA